VQAEFAAGRQSCFDETDEFAENLALQPALPMKLVEKPRNNEFTVYLHSTCLFIQ
jgi:hypothetical protein